ncbi:MAG: cyanophycin synthetase, partial [Anaerolineales bacterium]
LTLPLLGAHQRDNAATALAALRVANERALPVSLDAITQGFAAAHWPCRFEIARREPPLIFDSAHNEDSFHKLDATLEQFFPGRQVVLILGVSEDKHLREMLAAIRPRLRLLVATRADHPRALSAESVAETARQMGVESEAVTPVSAALTRALEISAKDGSIVLSAGSMFVTAEAKTAWQQGRSGASS